jgi:hypothetical protein
MYHLQNPDLYASNILDSVLLNRFKLEKHTAKFLSAIKPLKVIVGYEFFVLVCPERCCQSSAQSERLVRAALERWRRPSLYTLSTPSLPYILIHPIQLRIRHTSYTPTPRCKDASHTPTCTMYTTTHKSYIDTPWNTSYTVCISALVIHRIHCLIMSYILYTHIVVAIVANKWWIK